MTNSTRHSLRFASLAGATAVIATLAACGGAVSAPAATASGDATAAVTVTNCSREVTVTSRPAAAVAMTPSQTELLLRLGLRDSIVAEAQTEGQELPAELIAEGGGIDDLSTDAPPARETLLAVEPDFVFSPTEYEFSADQGFATIEQLNQAGAQAYVATGGCLDRRSSGTVEDVLTDVTNLGALFGVEDEAEAIVADAEAQLANITHSLEGIVPLRTARLFIDGQSITAVGAGVEYDMIVRAGGQPIYTPDDALFDAFFAAEVSAESVAAENPEVIVFAVASPADEQGIRDFLTSTFPAMDAVVNDRLIAVASNDLFPGTLGNVRATVDLAERLYPEHVQPLAE